MRFTTATVALVAVAVLLSVHEAQSIGRKGCKNLARRQRRLRSNKEFAGVPCNSGDIRREINLLCNQGLCSSLRRGRCRSVIKSLLINTIYPENCIIPTCEPEFCTSDTCRSSVDASLTYPANCPESCGVVGDCPAVACSPEIPDCDDGFKLDEPSCSCVQDPQVECVRDNQCADINLCRPGVCTDEGVCENFTVDDCCVNDQPGRQVDSQCTTTAPVCGNASGASVVLGTTGTRCFFCEDDRSGNAPDNGCDATNPYCGAVDGKNVGSDGLGDACFSCVGTSTLPSTGCPSNTPFCGLTTAGIAAAVGDFGNLCFTCINNSDGVDDGCTTAAPSCDAASGALGSSCLTCKNTSPGSGLDFGCSAERPICSDGAGGDIATNAEGSECVVCLNETPIGATANVGCTSAAPNCFEGDKCVFCSKFQYGDDFGCPATAPICGTTAGMPLVDEGDEGSACFFCQNTSQDLDPGCDVGVCVADEGQLGGSCAVCQNDRGSASVADLGCDDTNQECKLMSGANLPANGFGDVCM